ncbi:MAG: hypothetical protein ACI4V7_04355 [Succinivibrionaceae bacterium]
MYRSDEKSAMFDTEVIDGIHKRQELRLREQQYKVKIQYEGLKKLGKALWNAQSFEELVFGKFYIPFEILNEYIKNLRLPREISKFSIEGMENDSFKVFFNHSKYGIIVFYLSLTDVILGQNKSALKIHLDSWDLPKASWFTKQLFKIGLLFKGVDISDFNSALPMFKIEKVGNDNDYILDFSKIVKDGLDENYLNTDLIRIHDWRIYGDKLALQISLSSEKLMKYLKRKMPILFE